MLKTGARDWVQLLPLALYQARNTLGPHGLTLFEILYGGPPLAIAFFDSDILLITPPPSPCMLTCKLSSWCNRKFGNP